MSERFVSVCWDLKYKASRTAVNWILLVKHSGISLKIIYVMPDSSFCFPSDVKGLLGNAYCIISFVLLSNVKFFGWQIWLTYILTADWVGERGSAHVSTPFTGSLWQNSQIFLLFSRHLNKALRKKQPPSTVTNGKTAAVNRSAGGTISLLRMDRISCDKANGALVCLTQHQRHLLLLLLFLLSPFLPCMNAQYACGKITPDKKVYTVIQV